MALASAFLLVAPASLAGRNELPTVTGPSFRVAWVFHWFVWGTAVQAEFPMPLDKPVTKRAHDKSKL